MQKIVKKLLATALCVVTLASMLCGAGLSASAVDIGQTVKITRRLAYRGGQQSGEGDTNAPGNRSNHYNRGMVHIAMQTLPCCMGLVAGTNCFTILKRC